jgi:hypothetical protein
MHTHTYNAFAYTYAYALTHPPAHSHTQEKLHLAMLSGFGQSGKMPKKKETHDERTRGLM